MADEIPDFDVPMFKRLAKNDTGQASGHQGGMVIPKDLADYFPTLPPATPTQPTVDYRLTAILVVPGKSSETVDTRYQHQTWGGSRSPERRLTDNLGPLRNEASADDILIIERGLEDRDLLRLTLLKKGTAEFNKFSARVGARRWGYVEARPVRDTDISSAEVAQLAHEAKPLELFDVSAPVSETRVQKIARNRAFQRRIIEIYDRKCVVCGGGLFYPPTLSEVEAAHIVPRSQKGADDARNGISLCRSHHWAYDRGLFGVEESMKIVVPKTVSSLAQNKSLASFHGQLIGPPTDPALAPAKIALEWHMQNILQAD